MFEVGVRRKFTAFHQLIGGDWGAENAHHSHDYVLEIICRGDQLDRDEYLFDISVLEKHLERLVDQYSGQSLNHLRGFEGRNPSVELFARVLAQELRPCLVDQPSLASFKVVLWEHAQAWASFQTSLR